MNNPTPPRAPELQAALALSTKPYPDWENAGIHFDTLLLRWPTSSEDALEISDKCGGILAAEVYRLEEQVRTLRAEIEVLRDWGNKDCTAMADAELRRRAALAQPSETKETK